MTLLLNHYRWFFGDIPRSNAETMLLSDLNKPGSFLVRNSERSACYVVSIRCRDKRVRHYRIKKLDNGTYAISNTVSFTSIPDLMAYYQQQADGLQEVLMYPCIISEKPSTVGLSKHTNKEWEIDRKELKFVKKVGTGQFGEVCMERLVE